MSEPTAWTKDKPTEEGWYWYRHPEYGDVVVQVWERKAGTLWAQHGADQRSVKFMTGEWQPVEPVKP